MPSLKDSKPTTESIPQHTSTKLIIECKKSDSKPWVFFSSPAYRFDKVFSSLRYFSDLDLHFAEKKLPPLLAQIYPHIKKNHYVNPSLPRCFSYCEAFKNTEKPSEIWAAIDSVTNYQSYLFSIREQRPERFGVFSEFYFPVIVFEGCLFEATVAGQEIDLSPRSHLQVRTWRNFHDVAVIDVVTRDYFQEFFNNLEQSHNELVSAIRALKFPPEFRAAALARKPDPGFHGCGMVTMMMRDAKRRARRTKKSRK